MGSLRAHEGYLLIDHSNSPGVPESLIRASGLDVIGGTGTFESATYTCSHCNALVVMNPDRSRPREVCRKCMHVVCDRCIDNCLPFAAITDDVVAGRPLRLDAHTNLLLPAASRRA